LDRGDRCADPDDGLVEAASAALTPSERALLDELVGAWQGRFLARIAGGRAITLFHADFHLLGNHVVRRERPTAVRDQLIGGEARPGLA
jgi:hypothetical protein